ncbi:hypothetical protein Aple_101880 [Acrocarpospora pleiomorpha]|uniref:Uncharacterized protein n=1 Tax=Acrocarpospora pleiomorpha TaxID=90975 RepID=A0A5M3Y6R8_9ACTN|nr:hypothetical protein Aple_101880 [Acrocarpospora pleiomorpha]
MISETTSAQWVSSDLRHRRSQRSRASDSMRRNSSDASLTDLIAEVAAKLRAVTSTPGLHPDLGHC